MLLFLITAIWSSCSQDDLSDALNDMLSPSADVAQADIGNVPKTRLFIDGNEVNIALLDKINPNNIESISVIKDAAYNSKPGIYVQLKEENKFSLYTPEQSDIPVNVGESILKIATHHNGMMDYDFYVNGDKMSPVDLRRYNTSQVSSVRVYALKNRVDIFLHKEIVPHTRAEPQSAKDWIEQRGDQDLTKAELYLNGNPATAEDFSRIKITEVLKIENNPYTSSCSIFTE